jgi:hypothetical protein
MLLGTLLAGTPATPALANDSEAEWAIGGLVLKANAAISMDREELFISPGEVRVDYVYTNHSPEDREVLIAFPLPRVPTADGFHDQWSLPDWDELEFTTTVDGVPVDYEVADRAMVGDRDVTEQLAAESLPLFWFRDASFTERLQDLPEADRQRLLAAGLLQTGDDAELTGEVSWVYPAWQVQRSLVRKQIFPAKSTVSVSHSYQPYAGGSVGGMLDPYLRKEYPEGLQSYRDKWCVDDSFLAGVDKKLAAGTGDNPVYYGETWLGYVLSSGANWLGPIKDFRLVVDKGDAENLVSFCMDGVRKISPTQFEVVKQDFEPTRDLDILILDFYRPSDEY